VEMERRRWTWCFRKKSLERLLGHQTRTTGRYEPAQSSFSRHSHQILRQHASISRLIERVHALTPPAIEMTYDPECVENAGTPVSVQEFMLTYTSQPDEASPSCDSPKCRSSFNIFVRKHHCRHCGHIFCSEHTAYTIPLDQYAKFHPDGIQSRACDSCYRQYQKWDAVRSLRRKNSENSTADGRESATALAEPDRSVHSPQMSAKPSEPVASSVPKDWAWSTF
jgi:hypothetical protein